MSRTFVDYSATCETHGEHVETIELLPEDDPVVFIDCPECGESIRVLAVSVQDG